MLFKNLLRHRGRTLLTLAGIAVGVTVIVALGAVANGLRDGYAEAFSGSDADLILTQKGAWTITSSVIPTDLGPQLAALEGVRSVAGMYYGVVSTKASPFFFVFGHDPQGFAAERYKIVAGQSLSAAPGDVPAVIVGRLAARSQGLQVGDELLLNDRAHRVVGIYETGSGLEDAGAVISLSDAQTLFDKAGQVGSYLIKLQSPDLAEDVRNRIEDQFSQVQAFVPNELANLQQTIRVVQGVSWALAFLAIVIGSVGMINTMAMNVFERTREIGTLRALGWSAGRVLRLVLAESLTLAILGGVIGSAAGVLIATAMGRVPLLSFVESGASLGLLIQGIGIAVVLGLLGGLYPAWRASRLLPVEALRYEAGAEVSKTRRWLPAVLRALWRRRTRSVLTVVGLTMGITAIIALGGVADGYVKTYTDMLTGTQSDLVVRQASASDLILSALDQDLSRQIQAVPGVEGVMSDLHHVVQTEKIPTLILQGLKLDEFGIQHFRIVQGQPLTQDGQVVLGRKAANAFDIQIGKVLPLGNMDFQVVGLFETGVLLEDMTGGIITLEDAQKLAGKPDQVTLFGVQVSPSVDPDEIIGQIRTLGPDLSVVKSSEFGESLTELQGIQQLVAAIWVLAVGMGGLGMMNTLLMSVMERTREIGTLRALGWRRVRVVWMLLKESLALALVSLVIGSGLAALLGWVFSQIPVVSAYLSFAISLPLLLRALAFVIGLSVIGGLYPGWRAAGLQPVEALRYE